MCSFCDLFFRLLPTHVLVFARTFLSPGMYVNSQYIIRSIQMQVPARSCIDRVVEASLKVLHHTKQKQEIAEDSRCRAYRDFPAPCCMFCCIYTVERCRIVKLENIDECFDIETH